MPFEGFVGNAGAIERLRAIAGGGRRAHAYLFSGPDGVGKGLAAVELARALGAAPRLITRPEDKHEILIAQVHELVRELSLTSDVPRAAVFDDAHRMSEEAMNALLKTLEEPPPRTTIILVTHVPERLLGTLRSRCQTILFFPLPDEEIAALARRKLGLDDERARVTALLAGGSVGRALDLAKTLDETIAAARELQERVVSGELNAWVEAVGKIKDTEDARARARRDLLLVAHALREVLRARGGGPAPCLALPAFVQAFRTAEDEDLAGRIEVLLDRIRMIDLNANVGLAVEDALLRI